MSIKLDRKSLNLLLSYHPKTQLALLFGVSLPTLRKFCNGDEPHSIAVTEYINREMRRLLTKSRKQREK